MTTFSLVRNPAIPLALALCAVANPAFSQTTFNGGNVFSAASWSNGLPSVGNNGTIAANGDFSGVFNFNQNTAGTVTVNITGGTLTSTGANFFNGPINTDPGLGDVSMDPIWRDDRFRGQWRHTQPEPANYLHTGGRDDYRHWIVTHPAFQRRPVRPDGRDGEPPGV